MSNSGNSRRDRAAAANAAAMSSERRREQLIRIIGAVVVVLVVVGIIAVAVVVSHDGVGQRGVARDSGVNGAACAQAHRHLLGSSAVEKRNPSQRKRHD